jgi:hypothetical protein
MSRPVPRRQNVLVRRRANDRQISPALREPQVEPLSLQAPRPPLRTASRASSLARTARVPAPQPSPSPIPPSSRHRSTTRVAYSQG